MDYKEKYEAALAVAQETYKTQPMYREWLAKMFPELAESEDERIRKALIHLINEQDGFLTAINGVSVKDIIAWLEKHFNEPKWCHHKVDLSNCSEEYRKAYYESEKTENMSKIDEMAQKAYPINENMDLSYRMADAGLQLAYRQGANAVLSEIEKCLESDHSENCHFTIYQNIIETIKKLKGE